MGAPGTSTTTKQKKDARSKQRFCKPETSSSSLRICCSTRSGSHSSRKPRKASGNGLSQMSLVANVYIGIVFNKALLVHQLTATTPNVDGAFSFKNVLIYTKK